MSRLEVLVEEPSAEEALRHILPKIIARRAAFRLINMRSKGRLLRELPKRLRAYRRRIDQGEDLRILVLVDRDDDDCMMLKRRLELAARDAGLFTKSAPDGNGCFQVVNRIVIEELEAWFMGDQEALKGAFPSLRHTKFPTTFQNPDNGGTWERLHRFLKQHGIYKKSYPKIDAARRIAPHVEPARNCSRSFRRFSQGVEALL